MNSPTAPEYLKAGAILQAGDEWDPDNNGGWRPTSRIGESLSDNETSPYRRSVQPSAEEVQMLPEDTPTLTDQKAWNLYPNERKAPPAPATAQAEPSGDGVQLIAQERQRQIEKEGWSREHDKGHDQGELARAAACYTCPNAIREFGSQRGHLQYDSVDRPDTLTWPFEPEELKLGDEIRNLVKAGALIAAEIDRLLAIKAAMEKETK